MLLINKIESANLTSIEKDKYKIYIIWKNYDDTEHCASHEIMGYHRDRALTKEEQKEYFTKRYENVQSDIIVSYCNDGVNMSDKNGIHILELLFPNQ